MASAAIAAGGSILSGILGGKGASAAAKQQAQAAQQGINLQRDMFNQTQDNIRPNIDAGRSALYSQLRLLGLGDGLSDMPTENQQANEITSLESSPLYQGIFDRGKEAVLQSAAATGGIRGGNVNTSLAGFGSDLLQQTIMQRLQALSGISGAGLGAATGLGSLGQNYANSTSTLLGQQGNANATSAAAPYSAAVNTIGGLQSILSANTGGGGMNKFAQQWGWNG